MYLRGQTPTTFASSRAKAWSSKLAGPPEMTGARCPASLPAVLAFLSAYGVADHLLHTAAEEARSLAVSPEAALLASGRVEERFYYRCLAHQLGVAFVESGVAPSASARYPSAIHRGLIPLDEGEGRRWLCARGRLLAELLARAARGEHFSTDLAITTPAHLSRVSRAGAASQVVWEASLGLAALDPNLSAKAGASPPQRAAAMAIIGTASFAFGLIPSAALAVLSLLMTCFFLASIWLRLFAGAASTACCRTPFEIRATDRRLPVYSVIVALHKEARVVPQLISALSALDYPGIMAQTPQAI